VLKLVVELFGEGNIILTNDKNVIIHALAFKKMRDRDILHNVVLELPPSSGKNPFKVTKSELEEAFKNAGETEVVRSTARFLGVGGVYAEEILLRANVDKTKHCNNLTGSEVTGIFEALQTLLAAVSGGSLEACIVLGEEGEFLDVVPIKLKRYEGFKTQIYETFNQALDEFYLRVTVAERAVNRVEVDKIKKEAERMRRMVAEQEKSIHEDEAKAERDKLVGNIIYAHFNELQTFQEQLLKANQQGHDWEKIIEAVMVAKKVGKRFLQLMLNRSTAKTLH
jgi:predicted ribosome quality control (RQC) complex YloA/Tae2 family protein